MSWLRASSVALAVVAFACGAKEGDKDKEATGSAKISLALKLGSDGSLCSGATQCLNVAASASNIESLKYHVNSIQICESLEVTGTAFGNVQGCLNLFDAQPTQVSNNLAVEVTEAAGSDEGWYDFMNADSRAKLSAQIEVGPHDARSYHWGLISVDPIVKVKATAVRAGTVNDDALYTHPGTAQTCSVNDNTYDCVVSATALTQGPAEEAAFRGHATGWFKFQAPFVITPDELAASPEYVLDLAFDPDGLIQGVTDPGATNFPPLLDNAMGAGNTGGGGANSMSLAELSIAPIAHKASSVVMKETYLGTVTGSDSFDLRVEFFYLSDDPSKAIYSVNVAAIPNANTQSYIAGAPYAYHVKTNADGSVTLENYDHTPNYSNFHRVAVVGQTTTVDVNFGVGMVPGLENTHPVTFELKALGALR
jgi:hypothetical protein